MFRHTPIRRRFTYVILLATGVALLIAYVGFVGVEVHATRLSMARDLDVLANVVALNTTAAISFENRTDAQQTLEALRAEPQLIAAWVYDQHGNVFASYSKEGASASQLRPIRDIFLFPTDEKQRSTSHSERPRYLLEGSRLLLTRPIVLDRKRIGSIYLEASLGELSRRISFYAGIVLFVFLGSLMVAFALTSVLRRTVIDPIVGLASTARLIADRGDYSLRAVKRSADEIGLLTDDFNQMLAVIQKSTLDLRSQIGKRIEAEERLRALNEGLEQRVADRTQELLRSNQELEQFAYIASHDLQEPLRMVASYMQLIESRYKDHLDADAREFIGFAVDGAKRMQELIQGLLSYSRVGSRAKRFELTSCSEVMEAAMADLKLAIEEQDATITHESLPTLYADGTQLAQLFNNLLSNALKFRGVDPPKIHVSAILSDGQWTFSFKDNGIGIEPRYFERIFVMFQRLHSRRKYPGTGIGLAICKKIVEHHGGKLWVDSAPGQGTTFFFTIPERTRP